MSEHYFEEVGALPRHVGNLGYTYAVGFGVSLALTLVAYILAVNHALSREAAIVVLIALALVQCAVQLFAFLHISEGTTSRARLAILGFAALVVFILVSGSLWILTTLNARMMPNEQQMEQYMNDQSGF